MFSLPGSLPRSRIRKLRAKCLEQVTAKMNELDAQERAYQAKLAAQKREKEAAQLNNVDNNHDKDKAEEKEEVQEEFDDSEQDETVAESDIAPQQRVNGNVVDVPHNTTAATTVVVDAN